MRSSFLDAVAAASLFMAVSPALAAGTFVPVSLSGAQSTSLFGINDSNTIVGQYTNSSGVIHGFISDFAGDKVTNIDDPSGDTEARGMNDKDSVTGYDVGTYAPWQYSPKGVLTAITRKGTDLDQLVQGINSAGVFTGDYTNQTSLKLVGYIGKNAKWSSNIKLPIKNLGYAGRAIDNAGDLAGWYYDTKTDLQRGWLLMKGSKTPVLIDYPNATYTVVEGMNNNGIVTGQWEDSSSVIHGYIYTVKTKKFTDLDVSGATLTQVWNINNNDVIAVTSSSGSYAYCMTSKGCPSAAGRVSVPPAKYTPFQN